MKLDAPKWTAVWTQAETDIGGGPDVSDVTLRIQIPLTATGSALRVMLSNRFGTEPVVIGEAAILSAGRASMLSFGGQPCGEIAPGAELTSDALAIAVTEPQNITLDVYLPGRTSLSSGNIAGAAWCLSDRGNHVGHPLGVPVVTPSTTLPDGLIIPHPTPLIRGVEILTDHVTAVVACLGDSITAAGWPNLASSALADRGVVMLNRGIPGNRLCRSGAGPSGAFFGRSGLERFTCDVLGTSGVTHAVIALGTNDIGQPGTPAAPLENVPTASELMSALDVLIQRCKAAGITPVLATITPFLPAAGYDDDREEVRRRVNEWIRAASPSTMLLDFDRALSASAAPSQLADQYNSGDHLHPSTAGQSRLAEECLTIFT